MELGVKNVSHSGWISKKFNMNNKMQSRSKRNELLKSGAYDGRYRQRVVVDKKKKHSRNWARKNKN